MKDDKNIVVVPVHEKLLLTVNEAAAYSNIGINKISRDAQRDGCPFVLYVGKRRHGKAAKNLKNIFWSLCDFE